MEAILNRRQWAETVRLYTGLLSTAERDNFLKKLASSNILLAAECRATIFTENSQLDHYLTAFASKLALEFDKPVAASQALLALAELNQFEKISEIFKTIKPVSTDFVHREIVTNYIANANEAQILLLLAVLTEYNHKLLTPALDRLIELNHPFSTLGKTQAMDIVEKLNDSEKNTKMLRAKVICTFGLNTLVDSPNTFLDFFLREQQIKYADRTAVVVRPKPTLKINDYLDGYINMTAHVNLVKGLLGVFRKLKAQGNEEYIRLTLSKHLNPLVKKMAIDLEGFPPLEAKLAKKIAFENINIGTKTSIEFAFNLIEEYKLGAIINYGDVVSALLTERKPQRLELALKIILGHDLKTKFPINLIYNLALSLERYEGYLLARDIAKNFFPLDHVIPALIHIACLASVKDQTIRIAKDIMLSDIIDNAGDTQIARGKSYMGHVNGFYKGMYLIGWGTGAAQFSIKEEKANFLKLGTYLEFHFNQIEDKIADSEIIVTAKYQLPKMKLKFFFGSYYIGQIVYCKVHQIKKQQVILRSSDENTTLILPVNELTDSYVDNISNYLSIDEEITVLITAFNKRKQFIFCSLKQIAATGDTLVDIRHRDAFNKKLVKLKSKYVR